MKIMKIFISIKNKLNKKYGETITEVLVASLVIAFGSIILATMVVASTRITRKSIEAYDRYISIHNATEMLQKDVDISDVQKKTNEIVNIDTTKSVTISGGTLHPFADGHEDNTGDSISCPGISISVKLYTVPKITDHGDEETQENKSVPMTFSKYYF